MQEPQSYYMCTQSRRSSYRLTSKETFTVH